jgi:hypothetical protein
MKDLKLPLIGKWFHMTKKLIKPEDYRDINEYWIKRLFKYPEIFNVLNNCCVECKYRKDFYSMPGCSFDGKNKTNCDNGLFAWNDRYFKKFKSNIMTLGYPKKGDPERTIQLEHKGILIGYGNPEWGAEPGKLYFVIKHGKIL